MNTLESPLLMEAISAFIQPDNPAFADKLYLASSKHRPTRKERMDEVLDWFNDLSPQSRKFLRSLLSATDMSPHWYNKQIIAHCESTGLDLWTVRKNYGRLKYLYYRGAFK